MANFQKLGILYLLFRLIKMNLSWLAAKNCSGERKWMCHIDGFFYCRRCNIETFLLQMVPCQNILSQKVLKLNVPITVQQQDASVADDTSSLPKGLVDIVYHYSAQCFHL